MAPENLNLEKIPSPELQPENLEKDGEKLRPEKKAEEIVDKKIKKDKTKTPSSIQVDKQVVSEDKQERAQKIDDILAFGLNDIFLSLSPDKQQEFKQKGEETSIKINNLMDKAKVSLGKIIILIKRWLSVIPGVNRFFLEQEAKIKADRIIKLKKS